MSITDWEREVAQCSDGQLAERVQALATLEQWPEFKEQWSQVGLFTIKAIILREQQIRVEASSC